MTANVHGVTIFCDDVRNEVGNKYSLMGCYGSDMVVGLIPSLLPKLCAQITVFFPADEPPSCLIARALLGDEVIGELITPEGDPRRIAEQLIADHDDVEKITMQVILVFSPLSISEPATLRIEIEADGETVRAGRLKIRTREEGATPQS